jgi:hypothetical protein
MKQIANNYTFHASEGVVTISGITIPLQRILSVVNATRNQVIFSAEPGRGATSANFVNGNTVLALQYDTTAFADSDSLSIYYDDGLSREEALTLTDLDKIAGSYPVEWLKAPAPGQEALRVPVDLGSSEVGQIKRVALLEVTGTAPADSTEILAENPNRNYLLFQNLSEQPIHLSFSGPATTSTLRVDGGWGLVFESGIAPTNAVAIVQTAQNQSYYLAHA